VLITTKRVPAGTTGKQVRDGGFVETVRMPVTAVPKDALPKVDSALDELVVTSDVGARQLLLRGSFGTKASVSGGLPVPDGKMAVSVTMSASEQVAGFVVPGAKIAIFDSFNAVDGKTPIPSGEKLSFSRDAVQTTRILFPSVEVIAVGTRGAPNAATSDTVNQTATSGVAGTGTGTGTGAANGPQSSDGGSLLVTVAV